MQLRISMRGFGSFPIFPSGKDRADSRQPCDSLDEAAERCKPAAGQRMFRQCVGAFLRGFTDDAEAAARPGILGGEYGQPDGDHDKGGPGKYQHCYAYQEHCDPHHENCNAPCIFT